MVKTRNIVPILFLMLAIMACTPDGGDMPAIWPDFVPGHVLVKFRDGVTATAGEKIGPLDVYALPVIAASDESLRDTTVRRLEELWADPSVEWAELDYIARIPLQDPSAKGMAPLGGVNDPYFGRQWGPTKIKAPQAWDIEWGQASSIVAIVDTGVDCNHPDLASKCLPGKDYVDNDDDPKDQHGHGTHVAGIAAAIGNNGRGAVGICPGCAIRPVRVLDRSGRGSYSSVARGITWAAGVTPPSAVINLSLGGPAQSNTMQEAINFARSHDVVIVAAAGNAGSPSPQYPAAYPGVVAVAATDSRDRKASFSSYGRYVSVSAPGVDILSTCMVNRYCVMSGTSMASPHTAGLVGLIRSRWPSWTSDEVVARLKEGVDPLQDAGMGTGRINALLALSGQAPTPGPTQPATRTPIPRPTSTPSGNVETQTEQLINDYRRSLGLSTLPSNSILRRIARDHSVDIARAGICGHIGTDGRDPFDRAEDAGYTPKWIAEIVACGYRSSAGAVSGWKSSPGHDSIMRGNYTELGCGYAGTPNTRWTCAFGKGDPESPPPPTPPPAATPSPAPDGFWLRFYCEGQPVRCTQQ